MKRETIKTGVVHVVCVCVSVWACEHVRVAVCVCLWRHICMSAAAQCDSVQSRRPLLSIGA